MPFRSMRPPLADALAERGYAEPTPVQERVIDPEIDGRDLLVSAQTGSGKTVAYGIAIAPTLLGEEDRLAPTREPAALVVAPTRELALQVASEFSWLYARTGARIVTCVGGMDPRAEKRRLDEGCHIVVGTPGRLRDHLERGALRIGALKALVLDEADEMLNLGFREDLEFLLEATPAERRTLLFSATLPKDIIALAKRYQRDALRIEVARGAAGHADIEYRAIRVVPNEMEHAVVNILRFTDAPSAIVFCKTREAVRHLHSNLLERGFSTVSLSGELGQAERNQTMQALRDGRARVCVATDVAARGIDLPSLGLVINADLPNDAETLQHRSGRTGRAGRKGVSVLLVPMARRKKAERLLAEARVQATWSGAPSAEEIRRQDEERLLSDPILDGEVSEEELAAGRALLASRSPETIAVALARLYRARLPAPEEVYDPGFAPDAKPRREPGAPRSAEPRQPRPRETLRGESGVWFRLDIGRRNEADPKWILPLLCRRGQVTRQDIGAIKIFDKETKFEVSAEAAARFASAAEGSDEDGITISRATPGGAGGHAKPGPGRGGDRRDSRPPAGGKPFRRKTQDGGPPGRSGPRGKRSFDRSKD
ncbi:DEAD/DEAH box helicase [Aureimonas endophytica]|uniref:DEAD/DEAH box helicase n=1 Tax=Aureimonas endophytica TaxID=2027858 RepID=A0A916ZUV6_9HYPH|nr:DEAD/DEAH box helicase [Aureimonas endophytica]GGE15286.1 DEAD/DEAH box helicase [Aureimonas endophytica]